MVFLSSHHLTACLCNQHTVRIQFSTIFVGYWSFRPKEAKRKKSCVLKINDILSCFSFLHYLRANITLFYPRLYMTTQGTAQRTLHSHNCVSRQ